MHDTRPPFLDGHINFSKQVRRRRAASRAQLWNTRAAHVEMCIATKSDVRCGDIAHSMQSVGVKALQSPFMVRHGCGRLGPVFLLTCVHSLAVLLAAEAKP